MPLWNVYCADGTYSSEDKRAFAQAITGIYAPTGMPRFYVSVVFHELPKGSLFSGGTARQGFVRIAIDHIARTVPPEERESLLTFVNKSIDPFVRDRGLDWEIHIDETPRDLWMIQGMRPRTPAPPRSSVGPGRTGRPGQTTPRSPQPRPEGGIGSARSAGPAASPSRAPDRCAPITSRRSPPVVRQNVPATARRIR
jgi:phenylpyruvate tautomerase PptA (4-oxalocrotonate tautomerase family)